MLLPVTVLLRRADVAVLIGAAPVAGAAGAGYRRIAAALGRAPETVRGWLRRFACRAEAVRGLFVRLLVDLAPGDPAPPGPAGSAFADAVASVLAAAGAIASRWPEVVGMSPWQGAAAVSGGRLLAPGWP